VNPSPDIDSDLLARYVAGEADAAQQAAVELWAASAPDHAHELERLRSVWSWSKGPSDLGDMDVDSAWKKVSAQMDEARIIPIGRSNRSSWAWVAAAAAVVGVLLVGRVLLSPPQQELVATTVHNSALLGDSSQVVLSPASRLVATMGKERSVELDGQAYFEVRRDERRPFVVHTTTIDVTVMGTAFEVTAFDGNDTVMVRVRHGKVRVALRRAENDSAGDTLILAAGEQTIWVRGDRLLERDVIGPVERWAGRIIQFNNAPLQQVVDELNSVYDSRIVLGTAAISGCPLTASFGDEPIDEIVRVIANTFGLQITRNADGSFTLTGDGC
jgi:transmembrane sensor